MQSQQQINAAGNESAAATTTTTTTTTDNVNTQPAADVFLSPLNPLRMAWYTGYPAPVHYGAASVMYGGDPVGMTSDGHSKPAYTSYSVPGYNGAASVMYGGEPARTMLTAQPMQQGQLPGSVLQVNHVYSSQIYNAVH